MTTCPKCQKAVEGAAAECPFCGIIIAKWKPPVPGASAEKSVAPPRTETQAARWDMPIAAPTPATKKSGCLKIALIVAGIALVLFVAVAYSVYRAGKQVYEAADDALADAGLKRASAADVKNPIPPGIFKAEFDEVIMLAPRDPHGVAWNGDDFLVGNSVEPWNFLRVKPRKNGPADVTPVTVENRLTPERIRGITPLQMRNIGPLDVQGLTWTGKDYVGLNYHYGWLRFEEKKKWRLFKTPGEIALTAQFSTPEASNNVAWDGSGYWNATRANTKDDFGEERVLRRFDESFNEVARIPWPAPGCQGLVWDGSYLWGVDVFMDMIFVWEPTRLGGLALHRVYSTDLSYLTGIAYDGSHIWVATSCLKGGKAPDGTWTCSGEERRALRRLKKDIPPVNLSALSRERLVGQIAYKGAENTGWIPWETDFLLKLGLADIAVEGLQKLMEHEKPEVVAAALEQLPKAVAALAASGGLAAISAPEEDEEGEEEGEEEETPTAGAEGGGAPAFAEYQGAPIRAGGAELRAFSVRTERGEIYASWETLLADHVFEEPPARDEEDEEADDPFAETPVFAKIKAQVRPAGASEWEWETEFDAYPGDNRQEDAYLADVPPGDYECTIFIHIQYWGGNNTFQVINLNGPILKVGAW